MWTLFSAKYFLCRHACSGAAQNLAAQVTLDRVRVRNGELSPHSFSRSHALPANQRCSLPVLVMGVGIVASNRHCSEKT